MPSIFELPPNVRIPETQKFTSSMFCARTQLLCYAYVCATHKTATQSNKHRYCKYGKSMPCKKRAIAQDTCALCVSICPKRIPCLQKLLNTIGTMSARSAKLHSDASGPPLMPPELLRLPMLHKSWR